YPAQCLLRPKTLMTCTNEPDPAILHIFTVRFLLFDAPPATFPTRRISSFRTPRLKDFLHHFVETAAVPSALAWCGLGSPCRRTIGKRQKRIFGRPML